MTKQGRHYGLHFTDEETEASCPSSNSILGRTWTRILIPCYILHVAVVAILCSEQFRGLQAERKGSFFWSNRVMTISSQFVDRIHCAYNFFSQSNFNFTLDIYLSFNLNIIFLWEKNSAAKSLLLLFSKFLLWPNFLL